MMWLPCSLPTGERSLAGVSHPLPWHKVAQQSKFSADNAGRQCEENGKPYFLGVCLTSAIRCYAYFCCISFGLWPKLIKNEKRGPQTRKYSWVVYLLWAPGQLLLCLPLQLKGVRSLPWVGGETANSHSWWVGWSTGGYVSFLFTCYTDHVTNTILGTSAHVVLTWASQQACEQGIATII